MEGTIGGVFIANDMPFVITAGHCVRKGYFDERGTSANSFWFKRSMEADIAVLPIDCTKSDTFDMMNNCYFDDDPQANDQYFTHSARARRLSFYSAINSITPEESFPFINPMSIQPGTAVMKDGLTTGVTFGKFVGVKKGKKYVENNEEKILESVVVVQ